MTTPRVPDLSKAVVTYLNATFPGQFTAVHSCNVIYKLPELATLRVNVWPASLDRPRIVRSAFGRTAGLMIAIQKRADTQDIMDTLTNLADDILDSLLGRRFASDKWYCGAGSFTDEISDRFEKYEKDVFQSVISAQFEIFA